MMRTGFVVPTKKPYKFFSERSDCLRMNAKVHTRFEKFLSSFLVFVMVLSMFPSTVVMAADSTPEDTTKKECRKNDTLLLL